MSESPIMVTSLPMANGVAVVVVTEVCIAGVDVGVARHRMPQRGDSVAVPRFLLRLRRAIHQARLLESPMLRTSFHRFQRRSPGARTFLVH